MGRPATLLEGLSGHALSFGAQALIVEYRDGRQWVFAVKDGERIAVANYAVSSADEEELRGNLKAAAKKPVRAAFGGRLCILKIRIYEGFSEDAFEVSIDPAPRPDPSVRPSFTAKQGQYLTFIHSFVKLHRQAPSERDLQSYFQVSPPSVHEMIKTLERNGQMPEYLGRHARFACWWRQNTCRHWINPAVVRLVSTELRRC